MTRYRIRLYSPLWCAIFLAKLVGMLALMYLNVIVMAVI